MGVTRSFSNPKVYEMMGSDLVISCTKTTDSGKGRDDGSESYCGRMLEIMIPKAPHNFRL